MKIKFDYIKELLSFMEDNDLSEILIDDGEEKVALKKNTQPPTIAKTGIVQTKPQPTKVVEEKVEEIVETRKAITSPMVGTFYKAPSQSEPPFVELGTEISQGDTVCIIEAMKLMNEIESEFSGKVVEICVENAQPVEFGQVLMYVE